MKVSTERFEELVRDALESLPDHFWNRLENVVVVVESEPSDEQRAFQGLDDDETLFGLYEGVPLTERGSYAPPVPDRITIFQRPLELHCSSEDELVTEVRATVVHEVAHYFGIDDDRLHEIGL